MISINNQFRKIKIWKGAKINKKIFKIIKIEVYQFKLIMKKEIQRNHKTSEF
jgi:hypothetical protein